MDSLLIGIIIVILGIAIAVIYFVSNSTVAGKSNVAVQLTDPPKVPNGTQHLLVSYSSVQVHVSGNGNQSGWISATGSGTVDLLALTNISQTIVGCPTNL